MKLVVGLGNIGEKYEQTRHNLGFMVLDTLAQMENGKWKMEKKFNSQLSIINSQFILAKPQTMMNASGWAISKLASFYKIKPENIWVVHDDVDLPLGKLKIRLGGAAAGHHGVESIIGQLGTDKFVRFRLGIGHPGRGNDKLVERYVLKNFTSKEKSEVKKMIKKAIEAIRVALNDGLEKAMARKF